MRLTRTLAVVALLGAACHLAQPTSSELEVRRALDALIDADNRRDLEFVVDSYCEDVELLPPTGETVRGRDALRARYAELFAAWLPELRIEHEETLVDGARARDRGRTLGTLRATSGSALKSVDDEYEAQLRLDSGRWRIERLSWRPSVRKSGT